MQSQKSDEEDKAVESGRVFADLRSVLYSLGWATFISVADRKKIREYLVKWGKHG